MRFKRSGAQLNGARLYSRRDLNFRLEANAALDRGAFLGKLWGLFGKPSARPGGFEYVLRDTKTGMDFIAYVGAHGPCYGGNIGERAALKPVLEAFEELLHGARAMPCAHEYIADHAYGGGTWVVGCRDGKSFDMPDRRGRNAPTRIERRAH